MNPGAIITGVIIDIDKDWVTVHAGLKSEGVIPAEQFYNDKGEIDASVGDEVQVSSRRLKMALVPLVSHVKKQDVLNLGLNLKQPHTADEVVTGVISGKVKGGFTVDVRGLRAFLPGSLSRCATSARDYAPRKYRTRIQSY